VQVVVVFAFVQEVVVALVFVQALVVRMLFSKLSATRTVFDFEHDLLLRALLLPSKLYAV
jgi:hypothetical protein